jgi:hypothetical protein
MPTEVIARLFRSGITREVERQLAELAAARRPNLAPVPMREHLAALPPIVPDPDDAPDGDEEEDETGVQGSPNTGHLVVFSPSVGLVDRG